MVDNFGSFCAAEICYAWLVHGLQLTVKAYNSCRRRLSGSQSPAVTLLSKLCCSGSAGKQVPLATSLVLTCAVFGLVSRSLIMFIFDFFVVKVPVG